MKQFKKFFSIVLFVFLICNCSTLVSQTPVEKDGFPRILDTTRANHTFPIITDLNKDGKKEIITWQQTDHFSFEPTVLNVVQKDGSNFPGFPKYYTDHIIDIASGDVDNDGKLDIAIRFDSSVNVIDMFGNSLPGFPVLFPPEINPYPTSMKSMNLYDLDNNGNLEIITNGKNELIVLNSDGTNRTGWPIKIAASPHIWNPAIGDVDNDGYAEIFVAYFEFLTDTNFDNPISDQNEYKYSVLRPKSGEVFCVKSSTFDAFHHNGERVAGNWPISIDSCYSTWGASPSLYINKNQPDSTFIMLPSDYIVENPVYYTMNRLTKYSVAGNIMKRANYQSTWSGFGTFSIADLNKDGVVELIGGNQADEQIFVFDLDLQILNGWPQSGYGQHYATVIVGKLTSSNNLNIMSNVWYMPTPYDRGIINVYDYTGNDLNWSPLRPEGIVLSSACADLDNDGSVEIIANSFNYNPLTNYHRSRINVWTVPGISYSTADFPWPHINHDRYRSNQYGFVPGDETVGINTVSNSIPEKYSLSQNYPNPFNPSTQLEFGILKLGFVSLKVYNSLGKEVATLVNESKPAGSYSVEFDGSSLSSGVYYYILEAGDFAETKRMVLIK